MKYIKTYETQQTPSDILDLFTDRIQNVKMDDFELRVERTKGSYKIVIVYNDKIIGRLYIQDIKKKGDKFYAEIRRVHVNDEYRDKGLGSKLLQNAIDIFGDFNLYLYPSPNRVKDLTPDNKEEYRNRLVNFYGKYGFNKVGDSNRMERYNENFNDLDFFKSSIDYVEVDLHTIGTLTYSTFNKNGDKEYKWCFEAKKKIKELFLKKVVTISAMQLYYDEDIIDLVENISFHDVGDYPVLAMKFALQPKWKTISTSKSFKIWNDDSETAKQVRLEIEAKKYNL